MILDGKRVRDIILDEIKNEVSKLSVKPKLVVLQLGDDSASDIYVKQKRLMCEYVGYLFEHIKLDDTVSTDEVVGIISKLNEDDNVTGILVQLPLPIGIDEDMVVNSINSDKDIDGLSNVNRINLLNNTDGFVSCTALGVMELLDRYNIPVLDKNVTVIGRSKLVGKPIEVLMKKRGGIVIVCHSETSNLRDNTMNADILVSAVGFPNLVTKDMVKNGAVILDVGVSNTSDGICGDVDFKSVKDAVSYITPVPGGVGPMTIAMLSKNILKAYRLQNRKW